MSINFSLGFPHRFTVFNFNSIDFFPIIPAYRSYAFVFKDFQQGICVRFRAGCQRIDIAEQRVGRFDAVRFVCSHHTAGASFDPACGIESRNDFVACLPIPVYVLLYWEKFPSFDEKERLRWEHPLVADTAKQQAAFQFCFFAGAPGFLFKRFTAEAVGFQDNFFKFVCPHQFHGTLEKMNHELFRFGCGFPVRGNS